MKWTNHLTKLGQEKSVDDSWNTWTDQATATASAKNSEFYEPNQKTRMEKTFHNQSSVLAKLTGWSKTILEYIEVI